MRTIKVFEPGNYHTVEVPNKRSIKDSQKMINMCYDAIERLGGGSDILAILGSWGDTLDDEECLELMKDWLNNNLSIDGKCEECGDEADIRRFVRAYWKQATIKEGKNPELIKESHD